MKFGLTVNTTLRLAGHSNRPGVLYRLGLLAGAALAALCALVAGQSVLEITWTPLPVARANGGISGVITHTTVIDFNQSCVVLPGVQASPVFTTVEVISTAGGELHLPPTFVDYFEDGVLDLTTRWITVTADVGGGEPILNGTPVEANNYVTLDNTAIRSQQVFIPSFGVRFFEGRVRFQDVISAQISTSDVGFGREQRSGFPRVSTTGSRLIIADADQNPFAFYAWGRDGDETQPLLERELTPVPDFTTFQTYRVEWDTASDETRFYVNGSEVSAP
ncbi:MAG: hypothetical protein ACT4QE_07975, partial [Anaerolineales bacterium]